MLTPVEMQGKTFKSGGLGYDKKDVDAFFRDVNRNYEMLYRENMELKDRVEVLDEGVKYYKSIEKTLQKALVLAEKTAESTKETANKEALRIEKEAKAKAKEILFNAKNELETLHSKTIALLQEYEKFKAQFRNLAKAEMDLLETDAFSINVARLDAFIDENDTEDAGKDTSGLDQDGEMHEVDSEDDEMDDLRKKIKEASGIDEFEGSDFGGSDFDEDVSFSDLDE